MTDPRDIPAAVRAAAATVKPRLRGWLHAVVSPLAVAAGIVLIALSPSAPAAWSAVAYAVTSVLLFVTSALYHRGHWSPRAQRLFRRLDHANIFLIIAGSYTPFAVLALHDEARIAVLATVWAGAILGAVFQVAWPSAPRWLYVPLYVVLGWVAAFVTPQLLHGAGVPAFTLIAVGGGLYTLGAIVYALRRPNPFPRWFGFHEVFHALTIAAFVCQYIAASLVIYNAA